MLTHAIQIQENKKERTLFDSWKEAKVSVLTGVWRQVAAAPGGDFEGPKVQKRKELAVHAVGLTRELGLEMERELGSRTDPGVNSLKHLGKKGPTDGKCRA